MIRLIVLTIILAWGCKGDEPGRTPAKGAIGKAQGNATWRPEDKAGRDMVIRPGDASAASRALAALMTIQAPALDSAPRCADYARDMSSFLAALGHQLGRLRDQGKDGVTPEMLALFGVWMDGRAQALEQMSRSQTLQSGEVGRLHRELVAAMRDLADALSKAYGASRVAPDAPEAVRVNNAVDNLRTTLTALGTLCAPP